MRLKDSTNIFYKRVEVFINQEDQDYNLLSRKFGYKCCFIRDLSAQHFLFEQFVPILAKKGMNKLQHK